MKCLRCGYESAYKDSFDEPPTFNKEFIVCANCACSIAAQARLRILNGNTALLKRMIELLSGGLEVLS